MKNIMAASCDPLVMQKSMQVLSTNNIDEEPLFGNGFGIEEELCSNIGLR